MSLNTASTPNTLSNLNDYTPTHPGRVLTAEIHAYVKDQGRAWVESIDGQTSKVRFDCGEGSRSRVFTVKTADIDPTREWKFR